MIWSYRTEKKNKYQDTLKRSIGSLAISPTIFSTSWTKVYKIKDKQTSSSTLIDDIAYSLI